MTRWLIAVLCLGLPEAWGTESGHLPEGIPDHYPRKKLIAAGWDSPSPSMLLEHLIEMEKTPFDGVRLQIDVKSDDGRKITPTRMFNSTPWKRAWFEEEVQTLRKVRSSRLTDNFLSVGPGTGLDWFDDGGWQQTVEHFRIIAWLAREGGLKGILFNPEIGRGAFSYNLQASADRHTFSEYARKARQRGRQAMEAIVAEYPTMTIFCMFLNGGQTYSPYFGTNGHGNHPSLYYLDGKTFKPSGPRNPREVLEQTSPLERIEGGSYNLLPAFLNGWLDAIPPGMKLVDGLEQTYTARHQKSFVGWGQGVKVLGQAMVAPENRARYAAQVQVGFGIYLDPYVNPKGSRYYVGPATGNGLSRMEVLEQSVTYALANSEEYVWMWGEKYRWWPTSNQGVNPQRWDEVSPGMSRALEYAKSPALRFRDQLVRAYERFLSQTGGNLLRNGDFAQPPGDEWSRQGAGADHLARGRKQAGALRLEAGAVARQELAVPSGEGYYGIRAWVRSDIASAEPRVRVRWKQATGEILYTHANAIALSVGDDRREGEWQLIEGVVAVPPYLPVMSVELEGGAAGPVWFDDVEVVRLETDGEKP